MSGPLVQAIGWALLHLLWQGALVAAILATALALLRKQSANVRYLVSCAALVMIVVLGVVTAVRLYEPPLNVETAFTPSPAVIQLKTEGVSLDSSGVAPTFSLLAYVGSHLAQIVMIWIAGVLILSARLFAGWIAARRLALSGTRPASDAWERSLWDIASALRLWRPIRLLESAAVEVPTVVGWLRPVVLLPVASLTGMSTQQIEMVLAHELAHIRRHDFIVNLMQSAVETLLFYHPAVWWISQRIRVEREHCCDDLAVAVFGDPVQYARALTRFEELRLSRTQTVLAANGGSLLGRVRRLVVARAESANWTSRWAAGAALLTIAAAFFIAPALPAFAKHEEPQKVPTAARPKTKTKTATKSKTTTSTNTRVDVEATPEPDVDVDVEPDVDVDVDVDDDQPTPAPAPIAIAAPAVEQSLRNAMAAVAATPAMPLAPAAPRWGVFGGIRTRHHHIGESGKLTVDDLIALRSAGVTSKYIDEMRGAGIGDLSLDDIMDLRMTGVTPAYIRTLADAGYSNLKAKDIVRLKASGVDAEFIRDLAKYRSK